MATGRASFSFCGVPMTLALGDTDGIRLTWREGRHETIAGLELPESESRALFARQGAIAAVEWTVGGLGSSSDVTRSTTG